MTGPAPDVLVVDDAPDIQLLVAAILRSIGLTVTSASGGAEALSLLADGPLPRVVVLDVQMPQMDGWETLRRIRADARTATLPVVLCTVKQGEHDLARADALHADAYVVKPFTVDRLRSAVRGALAGRDGHTPLSARA